MELEEANKTLLDFIRCAEEEFGKVKYTSTSMNVDDGDIEAISTILQELDNLQKENEELKEIDLTTVHIKGVCDEKERWRNKIREKIEEYRNKEDITEMCALQDLLKEE